MTFAKFAPAGRLGNTVAGRLGNTVAGRLGNTVARASGLPLMLLILAMPLGCSPDGDPPAPARAVFIDAVTKQVVVTAAAAQYPAIHPETGQATLMPAMHCPRCVAWRRVPPPDQLNQAERPLTCAKCQQPLQFEGPLPSDLPAKLAVTQP